MSILADLLMNKSLLTMLGLTLLLWNCRSIFANLTEFKNLIFTHTPHIICLTETWLHEYDKLNIKNYTIYRYNRENGRGGGLAILIHHKIKSNKSSIPGYINGKLEILKVKINITQHKWSDLLLLYNPCEDITSNEFNYYFERMGENSIICGDLNAHHNYWNISSTPRTHSNISGKNLFSTLQNSNFTLLTPPGTKTYFNVRNGSESTLDLAFGKGKLNNIDKIDIHDPCGSDHFPVLYSFNIVPPKCTIQGSEKWNFKKFDWTNWRRDLENLSNNLLNNSQTNISGIIDSVNDITKIYSSLKRNYYNPKFNKSFWTTECDIAINKRKIARKKLL